MEGSAAAVAAPPAQQDKTPQPGNIISAGKAVKAEPYKPNGEQAAVEDKTAGAAPPAGSNGQQANTSPTEVEVPELTNDQLKKLFANKGIPDFDGDFEGLGKKIKTAAAPAPEPTAEEKAAAQTEREKRVAKLYLDSGGKLEELMLIKQVLTAAPKDFSLSEARRELKDAGFDDTEIADIIKERYYQQSVETLEQGVDEEDDAFKKRKEALEKKIAFGSKKLESKNQYIRKEAENFMRRLDQAYDAAEALAAEEAKFSSKVDEHFQKVPRKITFELGEVNNLKIDPVQFEVAEADVQEVQAMLKDPVKRQQFFFNEDNSLNLPNVGDVLLRNKYLEQALKVVLLEGGSREVAKFEKIFPGSPKDLGVGGQRSGNNANGRKGVPASYGKPEPVRLQQ